MYKDELTAALARADAADLRADRAEKRLAARRKKPGTPPIRVLGHKGPSWLQRLWWGITNPVVHTSDRKCPRP